MNETLLATTEMIKKQHAHVEVELESSVRESRTLFPQSIEYATSPG